MNDKDKGQLSAITFAFGLCLLAFMFLLGTLSWGMTPILDKDSIRPVALIFAFLGAPLTLIGLVGMLVGMLKWERRNFDEE